MIVMDPVNRQKAEHTQYFSGFEWSIYDIRLAMVQGDPISPYYYIVSKNMVR